MGPIKPGTSSRTRWEVLAVLRFVLAWIVTCGHVTANFSDVGPVTHFISDFGAKAAVVGFFLVSGYSIAGSLGRGRSGFYRRRFVRVYPIYAVALLMALALEFLLPAVVQMPRGDPTERHGLIAAFGNFFFLQTFVVKPISFNVAVWSLAIEVSYYLVAPILDHLPKWVVPAVIAISSVSYAAPRHDDWGVLYFVFTRLNALEYAWAWFMGYYLFAHRRPAVLAIFAVLGSALILQNRYLNPDPYSVATFLGTLLVIFACGTGMLPRWSPALGKRALNLLGDLSYPLYLVQFPIFTAAWMLFGISNGVAIATLCLLGAIAAYYAIDVYCKRALVSALGWRETIWRPSLRAAPAGRLAFGDAAADAAGDA
jgi:peptidoglycan/LPS O-acetylase OafA/YrhL